MQPFRVLFVCVAPTQAIPCANGSFRVIILKCFLQRRCPWTQRNKYEKPITVFPLRKTWQNDPVVWRAIVRSRMQPFQGIVRVGSTNTGRCPVLMDTTFQGTLRRCAQSQGAALCRRASLRSDHRWAWSLKGRNQFASPKWEIAHFFRI